MLHREPHGGLEPPTSRLRSVRSAVELVGHKGRKVNAPCVDTAQRRISGYSLSVHNVLISYYSTFPPSWDRTLLPQTVELLCVLREKTGPNCPHRVDSCPAVTARTPPCAHAPRRSATSRAARRGSAPAAAQGRTGQAAGYGRARLEGSKCCHAFMVHAANIYVGRYR